MRALFSLIILSALLVPAARAQEQNAAEARLRDALRQLTVRVQTAEAEAATAKAVQTDLEAKQKTLTTQVEKLTKDLAAEQTAAQKAANEAAAKLTDRDAELARVKDSLEKWKVGHSQITELAKKTEAARAAASAKATSLDHQVADLKRKNLSLFRLGDEILTRLENFSYGRALTAREPFVGTTRVKLENEVQGYKDRLLDPNLKP